MERLATLRTSTLLVLLAALAVVVGAYVALDIAGRDTNGFVSFVVTVGGLLGLGVHGEVRNKRTAQVLAKIDKQTNGVLTERIENGVRKVLAERNL